MPGPAAMLWMRLDTSTSPASSIAPWSVLPAHGSANRVLQEALQPVDQRPIAGMDHQRAPVGVGDHDPTARAHDPQRLAQEAGHVADVLDHALDADAVELAVGQARLPSVGTDHLDVDARLGGSTLGLVAHELTRVDAHRSALWADDPSEPDELGPRSRTRCHRSGRRPSGRAPRPPSIASPGSTAATPRSPAARRARRRPCSWSSTTAQNDESAPGPVGSPRRRPAARTP